MMKTMEFATVERATPARNKASPAAEPTVDPANTATVPSAPPAAAMPQATLLSPMRPRLNSRASASKLTTETHGCANEARPTSCKGSEAFAYSTELCSDRHIHAHCKPNPKSRQEIRMVSSPVDPPIALYCKRERAARPPRPRGGRS